MVMRMATHKKRNLFAELKHGAQEIQAHKAGKITLRTHTFVEKPHLSVNANFVRETREEMHMSRSVFALKLRVSLRTLEKWEQGKAVPNCQAAALILLVRKYPDTLKRLERI
jgi:putative transcriptional regulator